MKLRVAKRILSGLGMQYATGREALSSAHAVAFRVESGVGLAACSGQAITGIRMPRRDRVSRAVDIVNRSARRRWYRHVLPNLKDAWS